MGCRDTKGLQVRLCWEGIITYDDFGNLKRFPCLTEAGAETHLFLRRPPTVSVACVRACARAACMQSDPTTTEPPEACFTDPEELKEHDVELRVGEKEVKGALNNITRSSFLEGREDGSAKPSKPWNKLLWQLPPCKSHSHLPPSFTPPKVEDYRTVTSFPLS